jgi:CheY-like chemotaxis protein
VSEPLRTPPKWILVADDDDVIREIWISALTDTGYRAVGAANGYQAANLMVVVIPDLMILDLRMPGLAGEEVLEVVRQTPVLQRIPVLIISGFLDDAPRVGEGLNIVGRLPKPLSLPRLIETVRDALSPTTGRPGSWSTGENQRVFLTPLGGRADRGAQRAHVPPRGAASSRG